MTYARKHSPKITDAEILEWILSGRLVLREDREVWKWHSKRKQYEQIAIQSHHEDGRAWVNLRVGSNGDGRHRTVYMNKLVWMWHERCCVPQGYVIDHADENRLNDAYDNLQLMSWAESDSQGRDLQGKNSEEDLDF